MSEFVFFQIFNVCGISKHFKCLKNYLGLSILICKKINFHIRFSNMAQLIFDHKKVIANQL